MGSVKQLRQGFAASNQGKVSDAGRGVRSEVTKRVSRDALGRSTMLSIRSPAWSSDDLPSYVLAVEEARQELEALSILEDETALVQRNGAATAGVGIVRRGLTDRFHTPGGSAGAGGSGLHSCLALAPWRRVLRAGLCRGPRFLDGLA